DEENLELPLEYVPDGLPVDAGGLHRHMRDAPLGQPVREPQKLSRHRVERAHFPVRLALRPLPHTGHDRLLVDVQPATNRIKHIHDPPPAMRVAEDTFLLYESASRAAREGTNPGGRNSLVFRHGVPIRLRFGLVVPQRKRPRSATRWPCPRLPPFPRTLKPFSSSW